MADLVTAAGGVVWRRDPDGEPEVLVIHRPKYDDWTLPKGKTEPTDRDEEHTAQREVEEETGFRCDLGARLGEVRYIDPRGRPKVVHFWAMQVRDGDFAPNSEVDEVRWVGLDDAHEVLAYDSDRAMLDAFRRGVLG